MKQRLNSESKEHPESELDQVTRHSSAPGLEFDSVESAIRFDAAQTVVPPELRERLRCAVEAEQAPLPWWKRWFQ